MVNLINASRGFTIVFFTAIIGILCNILSGDSNGQTTEFIYSLLFITIIVELCVWRIYEHYLDYSIFQCKEQIDFCEKKLKIQSLSSENLGTPFSGHLFLDIIAFALGILIFCAFFSRDLFLLIFYRNLPFLTLILIFLAIIGISYFLVKKNEIIFRKNSGQKKVMNQFLFIPYLLLLCGIILGMIIGIFVSDFIKSDNQKLDACFDIIHGVIIRNIGDNEIRIIVNRSASFHNDSQKLFFMSENLINNFTDPNWHRQQNNDTFCYYPKENISFNYCLLKYDNMKTLVAQPDQNKAYMFDKNGRVRQYWKESLGGTMLRLNPSWIAYQKTGECQELSILFNDTANRSGFETRIIKSDGIGHFWNEININGTWKFFDLQQFGELDDRSNASMFFGEPADYASTASWPLCEMIKNGKTPGIFVYNLNTEGNGENRNDAYDPNHLCK